MAFRANEAIDENFHDALGKLTKSSTFTQKQKNQIRDWLEEMTVAWGPVVNAYPSWHPLVSCGVRNNADPITKPDKICGYPEIDHVVCLRDAFITCPNSNGDELIQAIDDLTYPECVLVRANKVDIPLYQENANPVIVTCEWNHDHQSDGSISQRACIALMLIEELKFWNDSQCAESWETMRPYILGKPCGKKSSLFVNQQTGQAMKRVFEAMVIGGTFGPLRLD